MQLSREAVSLSVASVTGLFAGIAAGIRRFSFLMSPADSYNARTAALDKEEAKVRYDELIKRPFHIEQPDFPKVVAVYEYRMRDLRIITEPRRLNKFTGALTEGLIRTAGIGIATAVVSFALTEGAQLADPALTHQISTLL